LFIGPASDAINWDAVKQIFAADALDDEQRRLLLSGKSADGQAGCGPIVCACLGVGRAAIRDAIAAGACSVDVLGAQLKAGTNCGSCIPELKRIIAERGEAADNQRELAVAKK
jgi:assimilatory nitrate reductase catalytic subunit